MALLTIERNGSFSVRIFGDNHCGIKPANSDLIDIRYKMICVCRPKLDSRGFLFDQVTVDKYFQGIKKTSLSCENLVMKSFKDLLKSIKKENADCRIKKVSLILSPQPFLASIEYTKAFVLD